MRAVVVVVCAVAVLSAGALGASEASGHSVVEEATSQPASVVPVVTTRSDNAAAVTVALHQLGVPYVWGGADPSGFDCSGLPAYAYARVGKAVPHYTKAIWAAFPHVPADRLEPGDLVFFNGGEHMGMYVGAGLFVHAPHTGSVVRLGDLRTYPGYAGAVRP